MLRLQGVRLRIGSLTRLALILAALATTACTTTGGAAWYDEHIASGTALAVPHVPQTSRTDCGMAALTAVMAYHSGTSLSLPSLLDAHPAASPRGYSLGELGDVARHHGFAAFVVPGDERFLRTHLERQRPLIVPLQMAGSSPPLPGLAPLSARLVEPLLNRAMDSDYDHYVVVAGLDDQQGSVVIMDPARGPLSMDLDEFTTAWQHMNNAVLLVGRATSE